MHGAWLGETALSGRLPRHLTRAAGLWQLELPTSVTDARAAPASAVAGAATAGAGAASADTARAATPLPLPRSPLEPLLLEGISRERRHRDSTYGWGPLLRAVADNDTAAAARALHGGCGGGGGGGRDGGCGARGAAADVPGLDGRTPFQLAALLGGREQIMHLLHDAGRASAAAAHMAAASGSPPPPPPPPPPPMLAREECASGVVAAAPPMPAQCCVHGCSGHGQCRGGVCVCEGEGRPGHGSASCSGRTGHAEGRPRSGPPVTTQPCGGGIRDGIFVSDATLPVAAALPTPPTLRPARSPRDLPARPPSDLKDIDLRSQAQPVRRRRARLRGWRGGDD